MTIIISFLCGAFFTFLYLQYGSKRSVEVIQGVIEPSSEGKTYADKGKLIVNRVSGNTTHLVEQICDLIRNSNAKVLMLATPDHLPEGDHLAGQHYNDTTLPQLAVLVEVPAPIGVQYVLFDGTCLGLQLAHHYDNIATILDCAVENKNCYYSDSLSLFTACYPPHVAAGMMLGHTVKPLSEQTREALFNLLSPTLSESTFKNLK